MPLHTHSVPPMVHQDHRWGIVLAGGQGKRLAHFIKQRCGEYRPKQYCAIIGRRSMLRHTIDRIAPLFDPSRVLTTVNASHLPWAFVELHDRPQHSMVIQPYDRETGAGILLSLLHVHHADPQALVALFPADHFILGEERYRMFVRQAFDAVTADPERIVILGVPPTSLQSGYGWIEPERTEQQRGIRPVKQFWEKPDDQLTRYLQDKQCLWNTMTLVGSSARLLSLMEQFMASIVEPCRAIVPVLGTRREPAVTEEVFAALPVVNFSRALLERIPHLLSVLPLEKVYWSDWGEEQRIRADIDAMEHRTLPFDQDRERFMAD